MKKIIVIALLVVAIAGFGDSWLSVDVVFQLGWIADGNLLFYTPENTEYCGSIDKAFDSVFKIDAIAFNHILAGGTLTSNFNSITKGASPVNFIPTGMTFQVYLGIQFIKGLSIIYEHSCSHPVTPYFQLQGGIPGLNSAYNRVYFELKGTLDF